MSVTDLRRDFVANLPKGIEDLPETREFVADTFFGHGIGKKFVAHVMGKPIMDVDVGVSRARIMAKGDCSIIEDEAGRVLVGISGADAPMNLSALKDHVAPLLSRMTDWAKAQKGMDGPALEAAARLHVLTSRVGAFVDHEVSLHAAGKKAAESSKGSAFFESLPVRFTGGSPSLREVFDDPYFRTAGLGKDFLERLAELPLDKFIIGECLATLKKENNCSPLNKAVESSKADLEGVSAANRRDFNVLGAHLDDLFTKINRYAFANEDALSYGHSHKPNAFEEAAVVYAFAHRVNNVIVTMIRHFDEKPAKDVQK